MRIKEIKLNPLKIFSQNSSLKKNCYKYTFSRDKYRQNVCADSTEALPPPPTPPPPPNKDLIDRNGICRMALRVQKQLLNK